MKQNKIKAIILAGVVLSGVYVWFVAPPPNFWETNDGTTSILTLQGLRDWYSVTDIDKTDIRDAINASKKHIQDTADASKRHIQGSPDISEKKDVSEDQETPIVPEEEGYPLPADLNTDYLILVNKQHALAENYKPDDLKDILYFATDRDAAGRYLRAEAADAFHELVEDAKDQGIILALTTGYRSYGFQSVLYNNYVAKDGQAAADRYSARPGTSEHQTGLAADVSGSSVEYRLTQELADTEEGRWLVENISRFGFILRYPEGKESITGYLYEPWHIRYVGNPTAEYIMAHGITLEEYLLLIQ